MKTQATLSCLLALFAACAGPQREDSPTPGVAPLLRHAEPVDHLIEADEVHFAHLWQLTAGGQNAEAYFSFAGDRLVLQRTDEAAGQECDRIYVTDPEAPGLVQLSDGRGVTTCAYFLPGDREVIYASTTASMETCPERPDFSKGYVWPIHPGYDLYVRDLETRERRQLTYEPGYDAEATVSPLGDRMVFTSTRSGDLELWTSNLDGSDLFQVTDSVGYDGGAFFSNDGQTLVFRSTAFTPGSEAEEQRAYRELLSEWLVRPTNMEIMLIDTDGNNRRQVTELGKANFAPFFFPDDQRILFASNHHIENPRSRDFDLFAVDLDGGNLERITTSEHFEAFPMFSPDGRYLAFSSNRGGSVEGETNVFLAEWK